MTTLKSIKEIQGYELEASDGYLGRCNDFLFDDLSWTVRYIVGDTRKWLPGRKVLISPISIGAAKESRRLLRIHLTKDQIKNSPHLDSDAPVSRKYETIFNRYHDWGNYWEGPLVWGHFPYPHILQRNEEMQREIAEEKQKELATVEEGDHLRSTKEVLSYDIEATDTNIGHIEDFIVDEESWTIRYLVIDTSNWLPGSKKVLISPTWVERVDWAKGCAYVSVSSDKIKKSPEYDPDVTLDRDYETSLFDFYNQPYYW